MAASWLAGGWLGAACMRRAGRRGVLHASILHVHPCKQGHSCITHTLTHSLITLSPSLIHSFLHTHTHTPSHHPHPSLRATADQG